MLLLILLDRGHRHTTERVIAVPLIPLERIRPLPAPPGAPVRIAEVVVKLLLLLPLEHEPAVIAPISMATSATETGQNLPE